MSHESAPRLLALHTLRLRGLLDAHELAAVLGIDEPRATTVLDGFVAESLVLFRDGRRAGFVLLPDGLAEAKRLVAAELDASGGRAAFTAAYADFRQINGELLATCSAWQMRDDLDEPAENDHDDADYDRSVIDRLAAVDARVEPVCHQFAAVLSRFGYYRPALSHALDRLEAGEFDWFTRPMMASYHSVWFEFHEDLLATLGINRGDEVPA